MRCSSLILVMVASSLFIACEEEPTRIYTRVSGTLLAVESDEPVAIPGAKIKLVSLSPRFDTPLDYLIDSTTTDELGRYSFDFSVLEQNSNATIQLLCSAPNYFHTRTFDFYVYTRQTDFPLGGDRKFNPKLYPHAWIGVTFPSSISSIKDLTVIEHTSNLGSDTIHGPVYISNPTPQDTLYFRAKGNSWNILQYFFANGGQYLRSNDSIKCGNNDTSFIEFKF